MKIALKGSIPQISEFKDLIPNHFDIEIFDTHVPPDADIICDLNPHLESILLADYFHTGGVLVILNTVFNNLEQFISSANQKPEGHLIGINGLPSFINRPVIEYTTQDNKSDKAFLDFLQKAEKKGIRVESRVGMVTPRVVCMIINEAYYTVQEGTAQKQDIDLGMQLGTAYPGGPFQWVEKIGIDNVYHTLISMYEDTQDERYKVCPLLKKEYMQTLME